MWVVKRKTLQEFWGLHPDAKGPLDTWYNDAEKADWSSPASVRQDYPTASIIANDRVVFNINANTDRLIVHIRYQHHKVFTRFIGTRADYDNIKAEGI